MTRKFSESIPDLQLKKDLEKYRRRAIELGASDAKVIPTEMIVIDERVRFKCMFPKCSLYGLSLSCPPYAPDLDQVRKVVGKYRYAILLKVEVPSEAVAGPIARDKRPRPYASYNLKRNEIVAKIEAEAFLDGHHLAMGFEGGSCKASYCPNEKCSALTPGQPCRNPLKARASMEAIGINGYALATRAGWEMYPIGGGTKPSSVPHGSFLGIVLIH